MAKQDACPHCGVFVKPVNLAGHLRKAHAMEEEAARLDRASRARRPKGRRSAALPVWGILVGVVLVLVVAAAVVLPSLVEPLPGTPLDLDEMCVQHDTGIGLHHHIQLNISLLGSPYAIPAGIGIVSDTCFRPVHTHKADGVIHVELPGPRDVTLGDFFRIWGKPLSSTQILTYVVDANHALGMSVNGVGSADFEDHVFQDLEAIVLDYHAV